MKKILITLLLLCPLLCMGQNVADSTSCKSGFERFEIIPNGMYSVRSVWAKTTNNQSREVYTSIRITYGEEKNSYLYQIDVREMKEDKLVHRVKSRFGIEYDELVKINQAIQKLRADFKTDYAARCSDAAESETRHTRARRSANVYEGSDDSDSLEYLENTYTTDGGFTIGYFILGSKYTWFYCIKQKREDRYYYYDTNSYFKDVQSIANDFQKAQFHIEALKSKNGK